MSSFDLQEMMEIAEGWAEEFYPDNADEQEAFIEGCIEALGCLFCTALRAEVSGE